MKTIVACVVGLLVLASCRPAQKTEPKGGAKSGGPVPVRVAVATRQAVPLELRTFGAVQALQSVEIRAQVGGPITALHFREGQDVQAGDLLVAIDARPMEAALKLAEANLARDRALQADAARESARQDALLKKGLAAQDAAEHARTQAEALAATVTADESAVANARLNLEYCSIRSPLAGRAGERRVDAGNLIKANEQVLVTVNQIQPVEVSFTLPQQEVARILAAQQQGPLEVRAFVAERPDLVNTGVLTFVDNAVDAATGTIRLKGKFENAQRTLWPGEFVSVVLRVGLDANALTIPGTAVMAGQKGPLVFVAKADRTADARFIKLIRTHEQTAVVGTGIAEGEQVIVDGQQRLYPGAKLNIAGAKQP
jgi:multidrug efflux system membrane fusion protein